MPADEPDETDDPGVEAGGAKGHRVPRTWCRDCDGKGLRVLPRMAVLSGGATLTEAMGGGEFVTGFETRPCSTCDATGWISGMVPPV